VLAEGRLINLSAAFGHPPEVMDMSFANQALCVRYIVENHARLDNVVHSVPTAIDKRVAALKLNAIGMRLNTHCKARGVPALVDARHVGRP